VKKQNNRNRFNRGERGGRIGRKTANGEAGRPESGNKPLPRDGPAEIGRNLKPAKEAGPGNLARGCKTEGSHVGLPLQETRSGAPS